MDSTHVYLQRPAGPPDAHERTLQRELLALAQATGRTFEVVDELPPGVALTTPEHITTTLQDELDGLNLVAQDPPPDLDRRPGESRAQHRARLTGRQKQLLKQRKRALTRG